MWELSPRRVALALTALVLGACATPVNYYASPGPRLPRLGEAARGAVIEKLRERARASDLENLELRGPDGIQIVSLAARDGADLESLPIEALSAALWVADPELRGAEFDLVVDTEPAGSRRIVTARHDVDRRLSVTLGSPPLRLEGDTLSSEELQRRFGIGPLLDGEVAWQASERAALGAALALLSVEELAYLRFLPFRRDARATSSDHAGYYTSREPNFSGGLVVLLDRAFSDDQEIFVGTAERAYPQSVSVILHELGHAIAKLDRERLVSAFERDQAKYNQLVGVFNQYAQRVNSLYDSLARASLRERREAEREIRSLEAKYVTLGRILDQASARLDEMADMAEGPSAIEAAYGELEHARLGPTLYGRTSLEEGFAESFALHHLDPESLERFSRPIHGWFDRQSHISAARFPPLPEVTTEAEVGEPAEGP